MKMTNGPIKTAALAMALGVSLGSWGLVGCAGDRYSRSTGEYIDDHSLELRVNNALNSNPDYKFGDVSIATFRGTVQLNGFVDLAGQKDRAGDITRTVPGVKEVQNNITVVQNGGRSKGEAVDDRELVGHVREALQTNPGYKFEDVAVAAYKGTVQLSGFVDVSQQKDLAGNIAKNTAGAKEVQNRITAKEKMKE